jgi:hypothetical protein
VRIECQSNTCREWGTPHFHGDPEDTTVRSDECQWCHVKLSTRFGFMCCDECSDRLAREFADEEVRNSAK